MMVRAMGFNQMKLLPSFAHHVGDSSSPFNAGANPDSPTLGFLAALAPPDIGLVSLIDKSSNVAMRLDDLKLEFFIA